jgi:uncharacterized HAD superfamily protein
MNFVSHHQMLEDVRAWSSELPTDLIAVAGVPRSGILPAAHLALHRNLHLITIDDLINGRCPWQTPLRRGVPSRGEGRVLVVEDSVNTGDTIGAVRERLKGRSGILYGALYGNHPFPREVDVVFRHLAHPRCFEWNLFHSNQIEWAYVDMDGVLCADWTGQEEEEGLGWERYQKHLESASPRHLPSYPVLAIVTSRLEKYRPQTIAWLRRHGVRFRELLMSPHPSIAARRMAQDHALRKAEWYRRRPEARLFVESHPEQACEIWERTGRPVLCTDQMRLFGGEGRAEMSCDSLKPQKSGVA